MDLVTWKTARLAELDAVDCQIDGLPEFIGGIHKRHSAMIRRWINEGRDEDDRLQSELRRWAAELERIPVERGREQSPPLAVTGYCSACDEDTEIAVWNVPTEGTRINICYHCLDAMNEGQG